MYGTMSLFCGLITSQGYFTSKKFISYAVGEVYQSSLNLKKEKMRKKRNLKKKDKYDLSVAIFECSDDCHAPRHCRIQPMTIKWITFK